jgi:hypothetical protein
MRILGGMSNELADAITALQRRRADAMKVVEKYDQALKALRALGDLDDDSSISLHAPSSTAEIQATAPRPSSPSVMTRAVRLLEERNRTWTVAQIIDEYERRDDPITAADPDNALRTALSTATKNGRLERVGPGVYRAAKFADAPPRPGIATSLDRAATMHSESLVGTIR